MGQCSAHKERAMGTPGGVNLYNKTKNSVKKVK